MTGIFQANLPYDVQAQPRLPGIVPLDLAQWLLVDDAFEAQMVERARLLAARRDAVVAVRPEGRAAAAELLWLPPVVQEDSDCLSL